MKQTSRIGMIVLVLTALLLSACGAGASPAGGGGKVQTSPTAYTGIVESVDGNAWVVNSQPITVDPAVVQGGPFNVGDPVKIEGHRDAAGFFAVTSVTTPSAQDLTSLPQFGADDNSNSNSNSNENSNDNSNGNSNENSNSNSNENSNDNSNGNSNDKSA